MFKLESYITPILLSYVDKYIKNFRPEDSQVSLWGGDASFHNLDLRLEVLEQELHLPFSFVSGHIHELLIHVPWTKLASEPITITINTIECILKLRGAESATGSDTSSQNREKLKRSSKSKQEIETPPGYVQSLVNKIVSNIRIYCNNLILKYVEEDIVLSMNVKLLTFESADEKWEAAYTELSPAQVTLRKLITINDLTVCLDKRNASGKIDVYQEPMLYRCSMVMHLLRNYHSATAKRASTTRLDVSCNSMEFSMNEQQVPMLMRLIMLLMALHQKQLKPDVEIQIDNSSQISNPEEMSEMEESWAGWAWSFVPSILPVAWDEEWNREQQLAYSGHTVQIGFYVDNASLTFKVSESSNDRGYYSQRKLKYWPVLTLNIQGVFMDVIMHGLKWLHASCGISQAILVPSGYCTCSHVEIPEGNAPPEYLKVGLVSTSHKADSLFDADAVENKGQRRLYNILWDYHISTITEDVMLDRSPAFAVDYIYQLEIPDDMTSERLSELGSDLEYSNLSEKGLLRIVMGPFRLRLCSGFFHRIRSLQVAASAYDYQPYSIPKPEPSYCDLLPPSEDDYDALNNHIPWKTMQITIFAPVLEFQLMDHPYFEPFKGSLFKKRKKISMGYTPQPQPDLPKITLECQCLDVKIQYPMYVKRLVQTTCQLPAPPNKMFEACHTDVSIKMIGFCSRLILASNRHTTIITPSSASYTSKSILKPQYWLNSDIPHSEITFESESFTITGTKAKIMVVTHIIKKILKMDSENSFNNIFNSSLLNDAARGYGLPYLELCVEGIRFKKVQTRTTVTADMSLGSIKVCIFEPIEFSFGSFTKSSSSVHSALGSPFRSKPETAVYSREIQQVLFISGPEFKDGSKLKNNDLREAPLFTMTVQYPLQPDDQPHPSILVFSLQEIQVCVDPLFCKWLLYTPRPINVSTNDYFDPLQRKNRNISEASGSLLETPRRVGTPHESIHSSSDRDHIPLQPRAVKNIKEVDESVDFQENIYNFLKTWFDVWKGILLCGDISQCTIYFPVQSLSAVGSQGIQQAVEETINKDFPPEILVLTLPSGTIRSASQKKGISHYITDLPVKLPENLWSSDKSSFPWTMTISDLSCYTLQYSNKLNFLKPLSLSATVGMSTKPYKSDATVILEKGKEKHAAPSKGSDKNNTQKDSFSGSSSSDIGCLGVCVHIDMSPIAISTSEVQICLIASILYGLSNVINNLLPESPKETLKSPDIPPFTSAHTSTMSPTLLRDSTVESLSERSPTLSITTDNIENSDVKLTAWLQWTIARFSIELLSNDASVVFNDDISFVTNPKLKLVVDAEDIVSSLDFQSVYLKIKSKIGSASIRHYRRTKSSNWKLGPYLGVVMRARDDSPALGERQDDTAFGSITITRASCLHTHSLWGAVKKNKTTTKDSKLDITNKNASSHYITEIVINLQPIDFILSIQTLHNYYMVLEPLINVSLSDNKATKESNVLMKFNNQNLPLAYLECRGIRIIMPAIELNGKGDMHDVCMFQIGNFNLTPSPVNPICRVPCRPDIYQQAAQARILNVPGSEVEDRQYQLDITNMSMRTGTWRDFDPILNSTVNITSSLRTMNENPALEWNNLEIGSLNVLPHLNLLPVIERFDLSVILAPAMVYKSDIVICGHSIEVNFISDIDINVALGQIKLMSVLSAECINFGCDISVNKRPKLVSPYPKPDAMYTSVDEEVEGGNSTDFTRDSGIDTDVKSLSIHTKPSAFTSLQLHKTTTDSERSISLFPRIPNPFPNICNNIDILFTGGKIACVLYKVVSGNQDEERKLDRRRTTDLTKESEAGYEASEEGSIDVKVRKKQKRFVPLFYISASQPNAYLSRMQLSKKVQLSCFDVCIKISGSEYVALKGLPNESDFSISLLETKPGSPHPITGVLPSFFTLKYAKGIGKPASLDIEFGRPTKILCSLSRWSYLISIKEMIEGNSISLREDLRRVKVLNKDLFQRNTVIAVTRSHKFVENYSKFKEIKDRLYEMNFLNVQFAQIVLVVKTDNGSEVSLSIGKLRNHLAVFNRPEKVANNVTLECITLGVSHNGFTRLLLNPWTISVDVCLFWESWQSADSDPQIQISAESDCLMIDISPQQIDCLDLVLRELTEFVGSVKPEKGIARACSSPELKLPSLDREQHYKDDLRAGAFQFVDSSTNNVDELPLPYQVVFWSQNIAAMAWRYPQPRALTKVRVFPVPFKISTGSQEDQQVLCHLEYWSDCHGCYQRYTQFYLSESEMCHLELPEGNPKPAVACTWRVVLSTPNYNTHSMEFDHSRVMISPRALAACMRIDSYFNKALIPNLSVALHISKMTVSLYSHFNKTRPLVMPEALKQYNSDLMFPETEGFLTLTLDTTRAYMASWNFNMATFDVSTTAHCSVLDYGFLTQQMFIEPFESKLELSISDNFNISYLSKQIHFKFGPCIAHTLAVNTQLWHQSWHLNSNPDSSSDFIVVTCYVICNDTNINLRFGQAATEEDILLPSRYCHLYCWRSQKYKQMLRVGLEENGWLWSKPFTIDENGTQMCHITSENNLTVVVTIKSLSATQKQITFSGQLVICNMLLEHFELKVVKCKKQDKDKEFKLTPSHIISGKSTPPSLLIDSRSKFSLRLRFFGLESAWSGDIPLMENTKCAQPWLVKVPLQERGQFLSIWCRIVIQEFQKGKKILAMLWPLFMIRSNLPVNAKMHIETPTLNVHLESTVKGKGEFQQLYCPGTIDHSHQLSFQLDSGTPTSNPYVPLNYSLVDQRQFFKKNENEDINDILAVLNTFDESKWPYFGEEYENIEWIIDDQPLTHVQVRYQNACQYSSSLLVELLPWCLLINTLGCPIAVIIDGRELCRVSHHGLVTPPKLEETFHIGVGIHGTWNVSPPLQLAKSDWSQTFYMPTITGTIPLEGAIKTAVKCGPYICMVSIHSGMSNEIRLLKISSTHVFTNYTSMQVEVICFAVPDNDNVYNIPKNVEKHSFIVPPQMDKSKCGTSVLQWYSIDSSYDTYDYVLYVSVSIDSKYGWSCPVRVDQNLTRKGVVVQNQENTVFEIPVVMASQEYKGQTYLSLHHDTHPQLLIENRSGVRLFCVQFSGNDTDIYVPDCQHLKWMCCVQDGKSTYYSMPGLSEKFPDSPQNGVLEKLILASDPEGDPQGYQWSTPIHLTNFNDQFIRIPYYGDVKVIVVDSSHTTYVIIESVSQVEISARDIRVRLSMHEYEQSTTNQRKGNDATGSDAKPLDIQESKSDTTLTGSYFSAEDITHGMSDTGVQPSSKFLNWSLSTLKETSISSAMTIPPHLQRHWSELGVRSSGTLQICTIPMKKEWTSLKISAFIKSITLTFMSDVENTCVERTEIASFTCDNIACTIAQSKDTHICISATDIQFDNQMYSRGCFDFPVVLIGQETKSVQKLTSLNASATQWIEAVRPDSLLKIDLVLETWRDTVRRKNVTDVNHIKITIDPLSAFIEDVYITKIMDYLTIFVPTKLILLTKPKPKIKYNLNSVNVGVPDVIMWESLVLAKPLTLKSITIEPLSVLLSVHSSMKIYIALDQSPLQFGRFERKRIMTTPYRLGHALTMHYLSGAIFGAGWVVGSLELLGSPGGLARAMGSGLRDFVNLPYQGLIQGPWAFLRGVTHGSASLMKHVTAGTVQSVTKLASSVARNLDRLTLDEEHLRRTEEQRRQRPQGFTQGFMQGLTGLGISLLGAVGGIAHHPLQSVMDGPSPRSLAAGVGLGLVGVLTKPLSGAAELVALTGQGLLQGAGWYPLPEPRMNPVLNHVYSSSNSVLKYSWKFLQAYSYSNLLFVVEATQIKNVSHYEATALILTTDALIIVNTDEDVTQRVISLTDLYGVEDSCDPTLLSLKLKPVAIPIKSEDECVIDMDPACRARVADYVRSTVGLIQMPDDLSLDQSEMGISPMQSPKSSTADCSEQTMLTFYMNPQSRNYFLSLLSFAKQQCQNDHFRVL